MQIKNRLSNMDMKYFLKINNNNNQLIKQLL